MGKKETLFPPCSLRGFVKIRGDDENFLGFAAVSVSRHVMNKRTGEITGFFFSMEPAQFPSSRMFKRLSVLTCVSSVKMISFVWLFRSLRTEPTLTVGHTAELRRYCRLVLPHFITVINVAFCVSAEAWHTYPVIFSCWLFSSALTSPGFHSGIMPSSDARRRVNLSPLLSVCLYFLSVMSSIFIVAGSLALVVALACWIR